MTESNAKRSVGYVRVSTDRQAREGLSLDEQQRQVEARIATEGWEHVDTFIEAGVSGRKDDRPELAKLLELVGGQPRRDAPRSTAADQPSSIDVLVIPKLDRLGRSTRHLLATVERLEAAGVRLVSLRDNIDTSTPSGRLMLRMLASVAEFESDLIGERVAGVSTARAEQGKTHGRASYGYRSAGKEGLVQVASEAAIVRRIFTEYVAGKSQRQIGRDLNRDGVAAQRGGEWVQGSIAKIIASPVAAGLVRLKGQEYPGQHEPIIDLETWRKATQLREATARTKGGGRGRKPTGGHLLTNGMLRCGCGSARIPVTKPTRTPGVLYERYACHGRIQHGLDYCPQVPLKRESIDTAIWSFFTKVALDVDATRAAVGQAHDAKLAELVALRQQAEQDAQRAQERLTRVRRDYQDGKLDADDWCEQRDELTDELVAANAVVERLEHQRLAIHERIEEIDAESAVLEGLTTLRAMIGGEVREGSRESVDAFRAVLTRLFARFELLPCRTREGRVVAPVRLGVAPEDGSVGSPHPSLNLEPEQEKDGTSIQYVLYPHVRPEAIRDLWDDETQFPALRRAALALRAYNAEGLTT